VVTAVSVCVCLSLDTFPHYCTDPDISWGNGREFPLVVHYWADLQPVDGFHCYDNIAPNAKCQQVLVLALCLVLGSDMQIFVRTAEDKTIAVEVEASDTIGSVKTEIREQEGVPVEDQRLIFRGRLLDNAYTLSDYKIQKDWTIALHVAPAPRAETLTSASWKLF